MEYVGLRMVESEEFISVQPALATIVLGVTRGSACMEYFLTRNEVNELIQKLKDAQECLE